jgi:hypothetical protein
MEVPSAVSEVLPSVAQSIMAGPSAVSAVLPSIPNPISEIQPSLVQPTQPTIITNPSYF